MGNKAFLIFFAIILTISFLERLVPTSGNNFYFTPDQANDAVQVREILERDQKPLRGPETDISGLYAGPLWYYFIAIGYKLFDAHPFGALFIVIASNIAILATATLIISKRVSKLWGILIGIALLVSWWFFDTARYAFNPFLLVPLSFILIFLLVDFLSGKKRNFLFAAIPIGLGFHVEMAGAMALFLFYFSIGIWTLLQKHITIPILLGGVGIVSLFLIPHLVSELNTGLLQTYSLLREFKQPDGAFSNHSFGEITKYILEQITRSTFYQNQWVGFITFVTIIFLVVKRLKHQEKLNNFVFKFSFLTAILTLVTLLFFGSNNGWRDWQTVYLYPLIFVSVLLLLSQVKKEFALILFVLIITSHLAVFTQRYNELFKKSEDQSILANELSAIDWVYQESGGRGFYVYSYVPPAIDYPYQYLFWWYGKGEYGYVPCDYSSYPGAPKPFYIPGSMYYEDPKRECTNLRFLIIEPDKDTQTRERWLEGVRKDTILLSETSVGKIKLEKREIVDQAIK